MDYKRILTLHYTGGMSGHEIKQTTGDGKTTVNEFLKRFREWKELSYPLSERRCGSVTGIIPERKPK